MTTITPTDVLRAYTRQFDEEGRDPHNQPPTANNPERIKIGV
jgi:hypothetical protein